MNSNSVHLIATDPPFNKGRDFHATPDSLAKGASFQDRWSWDKDVYDDWVDKLEDDFPKVMNVIRGSRESYGDDMGAFLCFMAVRLLEMWRVLRDDGSIYLHCDPTASHYLKELMDSIFDKNNFRNEIVWKRIQGAGKTSQHKQKSFGQSHDILLSYTKSDSATFKPEDVALPHPDLETKFNRVDEKGHYYRRSPFRPPGLGARPNLCFEYCGIKPPHKSGWIGNRGFLEKLDFTGDLEWVNGKVYRKQRPGVGIIPNSVWTDIPQVGGNESADYPTQKPLMLYERIIKASSNEGDIILDPFCGCATTCVAAEKLKRQWIGIDIWDKAHKVVIKRLKEEGYLAGPKDKRQDLIVTEGEITYTKKPLKRTDGGSEAVPFLETRLKQFDDRERDPYSNKEKKCMLLEQYGPYCQGCGFELDERYLELDHREPRSDGGSNLLRNRILLCGPCNKLKRHLYTISWLRRENKKLGYMVNEGALALLK